MSLQSYLIKQFNMKFSIYRKTVATDGSGVDTWALSSSANSGYMSVKTRMEMNSDGSQIDKKVYRLRTVPIDIAQDDLVIVTELRGTTLTGNNREVYKVLSTENIDRLNIEQVTECDQMNKDMLNAV